MSKSLEQKGRMSWRCWQQPFPQVPLGHPVCGEVPPINAASRSHSSRILFESVRPGGLLKPVRFLVSAMGWE